MNFCNTLLVIVTVNCGEFLQHTINNVMINCGEFLQHSLSNCASELW